MLPAIQVIARRGELHQAAVELTKPLSKDMDVTDIFNDIISISNEYYESFDMNEITLTLQVMYLLSSEFVLQYF